MAPAALDEANAKQTTLSPAAGFPQPQIPAWQMVRVGFARATQDYKAVVC